MSEEKHHHLFGRHKKDEDNTDSTYSADGPGGYTGSQGDGYNTTSRPGGYSDDAGEGYGSRPGGGYGGETEEGGYGSRPEGGYRGETGEGGYGNRPGGGYGGESGEGGYGGSKTVTGGGGYSESRTEPEVDYNKEEKHHKHLEQIGGLGAAAAGAYALVYVTTIPIAIFHFISFSFFFFKCDRLHVFSLLSRVCDRYIQEGVYIYIYRLIKTYKSYMHEKGKYFTISLSFGSGVK